MKIIIPGECVAKQRPRVKNFGNFSRAYTPEKTTNYEGLVALVVNEAINNGETPFLNDNKLKCEINIYTQIPKSVSNKKRDLMKNGSIRPTKKPDLDNCIKSILDGMNKIAFQDDKQIVELKASKFYSETPYVVVEINELQ